MFSFGVDPLLLLILLLSLISSCSGDYIIDDRDSRITYYPGPWGQHSDPEAHLGTT
jgi:hypothetical protein